MLDYLLQYGLFLAQTLTIVVAVAALVLLVAAVAMRRRGGFGPEKLEVRDLGARYREMKQIVENGLLGDRERKAAAKARKREAKARKKEARPDRPRVFVLDFKGDMRASAVASLREEVTAVLAFAKAEDEVLVRLENAGGLVHEHGFAASQLMRVRDRGIPLTVSVDRIAASGGYMMACVADRIVAAPFAILGSIGVLAQIPNFHRLLDRHGIDFEQFKGGEYKRTVTLFGENTDADRDKLRQDIEEIHAIFKHFVVEQRPGLDVEKVATGEHWLGRRARDLGLCDELMTSDDYLLAANERADLVGIRFEARKRLATGSRSRWRSLPAAPRPRCGRARGIGACRCEARKASRSGSGEGGRRFPNRLRPERWGAWWRDMAPRSRTAVRTNPRRGSRAAAGPVSSRGYRSNGRKAAMIVEQRLREKIAGALAPVHLEVVNESGGHNVPAGSETHFKVVVVSGAFAGKPRVAQHRMVFRAVDDELRDGVHALAVHTYTEEAWARTAAAPESPQCLGGKARESA